MKGKKCRSCDKINPPDSSRCLRCNSDIEFERTLEYDEYKNESVSSPAYRFAVYSHPVLGYEAIKNGFSWPAFFFTWIWAFIKKLWGHGVVFIVVLFVLLIIESAFQQAGSSGGVLIMLILQLGLFLLFGINGNKWRAEAMERRGFSLVTQSMAATPEAAIAEISNQGEYKQQESDSEYSLYKQIADELESGEVDRALWTKALEISEGDEKKQKAIYIKLRSSHINNGQAKP